MSLPGINGRDEERGRGRKVGYWCRHKEGPARLFFECSKFQRRGGCAPSMAYANPPFQIVCIAPHDERYCHDQHGMCNQVLIYL
jgi:hypothetical protein